MKCNLELGTAMSYSNFIAPPPEKSNDNLPMPSGVASGWHGWTMSRGPGANGGRGDQEKKKEGWRPGESVVHGPRTS